MKLIKKDSKIWNAAEKVLSAMHEYFEKMKKDGKAAGTIWLQDDIGNLLIFTRGEQRDQLLKNITPIQDTSFFEIEGEEDDYE